MVTVNIEIRYANSMVDEVEHSQTTKEEALLKSVQDAMEGVYAKYPALRNQPYTLVPSKKWQRLSKKVYWFKENTTENLCFIRKKPVTRPESEMIPVYLIFPYSAHMVPLKADLYESDDFLDP